MSKNGGEAAKIGIEQGTARSTLEKNLGEFEKLQR
jgi:hypothetical protein